MKTSLKSEKQNWPRENTARQSRNQNSLEVVAGCGGMSASPMPTAVLSAT